MARNERRRRIDPGQPALLSNSIGNSRPVLGICPLMPGRLRDEAPADRRSPGCAQDPLELRPRGVSSHLSQVLMKSDQPVDSLALNGIGEFQVTTKPVAKLVHRPVHGGESYSGRGRNTLVRGLPTSCTSAREGERKAGIGGQKLEHEHRIVVPQITLGLHRLPLETSLSSARDRGGWQRPGPFPRPAPSPAPGFRVRGFFAAPGRFAPWRR